jgi:hypothetical protein
MGFACPEGTIINIDGKEIAMYCNDKNLEEMIKGLDLPHSVKKVLLIRIKTMACRVEKPDAHRTLDIPKCLYPRQKSYDQGFVQGFIEGYKQKNDKPKRFKPTAKVHRFRG